MQSAKHKLSTQGSLLLESYRERSMQAQFLPDIVIYWYEIETLCKLDHTFLKINQTLMLFIKSHYKPSHTSNMEIKINFYKEISNYINLEEMLCWPTIY